MDNSRIRKLSVLVEKKHGVLSKVYARLEGAGYSVVKHDIKPSPEEDLQIIEFHVDGQLPLPSKLAQSILDIAECIELLDESGVSAAQQDSNSSSNSVSSSSNVNIKEIASAFAIQVESDYPNVLPVLERAIVSVDKESREQLLKNIGIYVGSATFKKKYSLGLPMKLAPFIKRAIAPELKQLTDVSFSDSKISLKNNAFCSPNRDQSFCNFLFGMIQGMVYENAATKQVSVEKTACRSQSGSVCTFTLT